MFEEITQIKGMVDGPTSIILAGVHGDEKCGVDAFKKILPNLKIERGTVFLGYGNPRAIEEGVRFIDVNLNRMFKDDKYLSDTEKEGYEYTRAQFLKKYLNRADALLDVHASNTKDSTPFIICEANAMDISQYLPVNLQVSGFDDIEPGGTDYYMNSIGKIGICIECGYIEDPKSTEIALKSIYSFLKAMGHIENDIPPMKQELVNMCSLYKTKTNNFTLSKTFKDFEQVVKNQIIGTDGSNEIKAEKDGVILFARNRNQTGSEAFLFGEKK